MRLYGAVVKHWAAGESYNQIIRAVEEELHIRLNKSQVSNWTRGDHLPDGSVRKFVPVPTMELGYVIGVMLGDGSMSVCGDRHYRLKLRVRDEDFAQAFAEAIAVVLKRTAPHVRFHAKTGSWHVDVSNLLLQQFLKKPIAELGSVIEQTEECSSGFLMGFLDSEGSMSKRNLTASNGNLELLNLVVRRLRAIRIETTGPPFIMEAGHQVMIRGVLRKRSLDQYYIHVRTACLADYKEKVGFSIKRKSDSLERALSVS
jgi:intein-encoded DNA endonuclease-like protein